MQKEKIKLWIRAIRPFSLTGSAIPVTLGAILAMNQDRFQFEYFILSIIAIVLLQASVNLLSDYDDYENKVDTQDSYGSSGVILEKLLTSRQVFRGGIICLIIGCGIGIFLSYERGIMVLILGTIGAIGGYSYTRKPLELKYKGFGAPLVFLLFGPLMVIGSYYVQLQQISAEAFYISIPVGLLTTAILHANDIRDIIHDKKAGIKTLSLVVGINPAKAIYYAMLLFSYIAIIIMCIFKVLPLWSLLCFLTLPSAFANIRTLYHCEMNSPGLISLDKATGKLQAQFGLIMIISIIIGILLL